MSETPKTGPESKGLWKILAFLEQVFCIVPLAVMTVLVFVAVICRYVFKSPIGWAEEVTLICMTWCDSVAHPMHSSLGLMSVSPF